MRRWTALVLGLVLSPVVAGCGADATPRQIAPTPLAVSTVSPTPAPAPAPTRAPCQVGARLRPGAVISVIGDSYTSRGLPDTWPALLARRSGLRSYVNAVDGSGYVAPGLAGTTYTGLRFPDQVAKLKNQKPDLVIIMGSINDFTRTAAPYPSVVLTTLLAIRAIAPRAPVLVVGSFWPGPDAPGELYYIHDVLREATKKVTCASFLDPVKEHWFDRTAGLFDPDGEHPNAAGRTRVTDFYQRDLRRLGYL